MQEKDFVACIVEIRRYAEDRMYLELEQNGTREQGNEA